MSDDVRERLIERAAQVMHRQRCACSWDQMEHHTTEAAARAHRGHFITRAAAVIDSLGIEMVAQHYPIRTGVPLKDAVAPVFSIAAASRGRDALGVPVVPQACPTCGSTDRMIPAGDCQWGDGGPDAWHSVVPQETEAE